MDFLRDLNLTELLFERLPVGIVVLDPDFQVQRFNPAWVDYVAHNTQTPPEAIVAGRSIFDLIPGSKADFLPVARRALSGETVRLEGLRIDNGNEASYWDILCTPLTQDEAVVGVLTVVADATEREQAALALYETVQMLREREQTLEQRVAERTRELQTLLDVAHNVASILELEPLLINLLEQLKKVIDYTGATVLQLQGENLVIRAHLGPIAVEQLPSIRLPLHMSASRDVILNHETLIIPDVHDDTPLARIYRDSIAESISHLVAYVRTWMAVPLTVKDQVIGVLSLDHSIPNYYTPQHAALARAFAGQVAVHIENAKLYAEARQRADEAQTLFTVQQAITRRLDPDAVLQMIADEARRLTDTEMSAVYLWRQEQLEVAVVSGNVSKEILGYRFPVAHSIAGLAITNRRPYLVPDADASLIVHRALVKRAGARSFVVVPLLVGDEPVGTIVVANKQVGTVGQEDVRVLTMLASGAVVGLENARLFRRLGRRTQELEALYRADEELYSHLRVDDVLNALVNVAVEILRADKSTILVWNEKHNRLVVRAQIGFQPETVDQMSFGPGQGMVGFTAERGELVIVEDTERQPQVMHNITRAEGIRSLMHAPIRISGRIFGIFNVSYLKPRAFGEEEQRLFTALAHRAALVIENARLYERAQEAAAAEERNRLARDLHDAVTQTLFSATLIADVLPRLWERDEAEARRRLQELRELTRGAGAEMRTLLLELRPATLTEVSLGDLLRQLTDALVGRSRLPIELQVSGDRELPPDVQVALYRIAQESLNNIVKHAGATRVTVRLDYANSQVTLAIVDNGSGFNPEKVGRRSLGLSIMRERADKIGASLQIKSVIGQGTQVVARWPEEVTRG